MKSSRCQQFGSCSQEMILHKALGYLGHSQAQHSFKHICETSMRVSFTSDRCKVEEGRNGTKALATSGKYGSLGLDFSHCHQAEFALRHCASHLHHSRWCQQNDQIAKLCVPVTQVEGQ